MFGIFKKYKRLFGRDAARSFNLMAAFLTNLCGDESINIHRPDDPSTGNPPCISVNLDWLLSVCLPKVSDTGLLYSTGGDISTKSFGTTSGTVAEGDHTHTTSDITDLDLSAYALNSHMHTASDITDWATATADFLTSTDLTNYVTTSALTNTLSGYAASNHTHNGYAAINHTHNISDFSAPNCFASPSNPCFLLSDGTNGIYHANQDPSVATVRAICTAWTNNNNSFGTGTSNITHSNITDWTTATSGFLTSSALSGYVTSSDLTTELADYVTSSDLTTELANYVTSSDLTTELANYVTSSDLTTTLADYVSTADLGTAVDDAINDAGILTTSDISSASISALTSGVNSATIEIGGKVTWNGSKLSQYYRTITITNGIVTAVSNQSTQTISTVTYTP